MFAILRCNRQESLVPEITCEVRDVYLHLPKTQLQVVNYDKYIFVLPVIKYNSYHLLKLLHTAALGSHPDGVTQQRGISPAC